MKKVYMYIAAFISLAALFSTCYYISYKAALRNFNLNVSEQHSDFISAKNSPTSTADGNSNAVSVNQSQKTTITPYTKYVLEVYDIKTDKTQTSELPTPDYLIGLTREEVIQYLNTYIKNMTLEEYQRGLITFELVSFSGDKVVLKKTYNTEYMQYKYYIAVVKGEVVVFYSDKKTIYEYTGISAKQLPDEDQMKLNYGIYVKDQSELYGILENYSS
jgi:hypothetical protein